MAKRITAALMLTVGLVSPAAAQTAAQIAAVRTFVDADLIGRHCTLFKIDQSKFATLFGALGVDAKEIYPGGKYWAVFKEQHAATTKILDKLGNDDRCFLGFHKYGPRGIVAKDLMIKK